MVRVADRGLLGSACSLLISTTGRRLFATTQTFICRAASRHRLTRDDADVNAVLLLVEPHHDTRDVYREYLVHVGYDVIATAEPEYALVLSPYVDAVVTALRFGDSVRGLWLIEQLRAAAATVSTPIVVCTTFAFGPERELAETAGCNAFLVKPCMPDALAAAVATVLTDSATGPTAR